MRTRENALMNDSEPELTRRSQQGDTEAFGVLVRRHAGRATALAALMVGNHADASDVSQEAFVKAWRHIRGFKGQTTFFTWYCSILRNTCFTWLRRHHKDKNVERLEAQNVPSSAADPALLAQRNEQTDRLWEAITALPTKHREIIVLKHFQQMSYKEIAAVLEIPIGTVMSRLHTAREALRARLVGEQS